MSRSVNPHFLPSSTTPVSRKDAFLDEDDLDVEKFSGDVQATESLVRQLNQVIQTSLDLNWSLEREQGFDRRKRGKIEAESHCAYVGINDPPLFRLLSRSLPPHRVILDPKPPPLLITREPDYEDNEEQAALRETGAQAVAVDFSWVIGESLRPTYVQARPGKLLHAKATLPHAPEMMIVQRDQPSRKTRPPVPASRLTHYPYVSDAPALLRESGPSTDCPRIDATFSSFDGQLIKPQRRRRKRGKIPVKDRPVATFWRPNQACRGKGLGYAMGYPCSSDWGDSTRYRRDTMRKGVYAEHVDPTVR